MPYGKAWQSGEGDRSKYREGGSDLDATRSDGLRTFMQQGGKLGPTVQTILDQVRYVAKTEWLEYCHFGLRPKS